jgi:hypothetical protein
MIAWLSAYFPMLAPIPASSLVDVLVADVLPASSSRIKVIFWDF